MNVLVIAGYARSFLLFREALLRELVEWGCRVAACAAETETGKAQQANGGGGHCQLQGALKNPPDNHLCPHRPSDAY